MVDNIRPLTTECGQLHRAGTIRAFRNHRWNILGIGVSQIVWVRQTGISNDRFWIALRWGGCGLLVARLLGH
jgi:hypothetical protein